MASLPASTFTSGVLGQVEHAAQQTLKFTFGVGNVPHHKHRLLQAGYLFGGLYATRNALDVLTGQTPEGKKLKVEDFASPVRPIVRQFLGVLPYDHFSDDAKDRWIKTADLLVPALVGGYAATRGSLHFFDGTFGKAVAAVEGKEALNILEGHTAAAKAQSSFLRVQAGVGSTMGSSSGTSTWWNPLSYSGALTQYFANCSGRNVPYTGLSRWLNNGFAKAASVVTGKTIEGSHVFNNASTQPFQFPKLLDHIVATLANNPKLEADAAKELIHADVKAVLEMGFHGVQPEQAEAFAAKLADAFQSAGQDAASIRTKVGGLLSGHKLTETLVEAGVNPYQVKLADTGVFSQYSRKAGDTFGFNTTKKVAGVVDRVHKGIDNCKELQIKALEEGLVAAKAKLPVVENELGNLRDKLTGAIGDGKSKIEKQIKEVEKLVSDHKQTISSFDSKVQAVEASKAAYLDKLSQFQKPELPVTDANQVWAARGVALGTAGLGLSVLGHTREKQGEARTPHTLIAGNVPFSLPEPANDSSPGEVAPTDAPRKFAPPPPLKAGFVNGTLLNAAEGVSGMLNVGNGQHRAWLAATLTASTYASEKIMEAMTGRHFLGTVIEEKDLAHPVLKSIYKVMPFNPYGEGAHDKWMSVFRLAVPFLVGAASIYEGSKLYFSNRSEKIENKELSLRSAEERASMAQADSYLPVTSLTSMPGFGSMASMLPFTSYGFHLGGRVNLGSGRAIALPVMGKFLTGNDSKYNLTAPGLIDDTINYLVENKSPSPQELTSRVDRIVHSWFKDASAEQVNALADGMLALRDHYYKEHGVPENLKETLSKQLHEQFDGKGLDTYLDKIGLSLENAQLAQNGLYGGFANKLGARKTVEHIKAELLHEHESRKLQKIEPSLSPLERLQQARAEAPSHSLAV